MRLCATSLILLSLATPAFAHRLDEYLQATTISLEKDRVAAQIRLIPGVAVFPHVIGIIDTDKDGVISKDEQRAYADRVLSDLSLVLDGDRLHLHLISATFPAIDTMKEGLGEIHIEFSAEVPRNSYEHKLVFENQHQVPISSYLVNCLVPQDPELRVMAQTRNYTQSLYHLNYVQAGFRSDLRPLGWRTDSRGWLASAAMLLFAGLTIFWRQRRPGRA